MSRYLTSTYLALVRAHPVPVRFTAGSVTVEGGHRAGLPEEVSGWM